MGRRWAGIFLVSALMSFGAMAGVEDYAEAPNDDRPERNAGIIAHIVGDCELRDAPTKVAFLWEGMNGMKRFLDESTTSEREVRASFRLEDQAGVIIAHATRNITAERRGDGKPQQVSAEARIDVPKGFFLGDVNLRLDDCKEPHS